MSIETNWDAIVIGAGLGGLTAAARLAKHGQRVIVFEQHVAIGGYAHRFLRRVKGQRTVYEFDVALHMIGNLRPGRPTHRVLSELGAVQRLQLTEFDVAYRSRGPEHDFEVPAQARAFAARLAERYPQSARGIGELFAHLQRADGRDGGVNECSVELMGTTLAQLMDEYIDDVRVRAIFSTLWPFLGSLPHKLCAFTFASMWNSYHQGGCFYIQGGGHALSNALREVIESHGGAVLRASEVTRIRTARGSVVGISTARRGEFTAPVVISNVAPSVALGELLDSPMLAAEDLNTAKELPQGCSIHQAYVGLKGSAAELGLPDRALFELSTYDTLEEESAQGRNDYGLQSVVLGNHGLADSAHTPEARSIVHASLIADGDGWFGASEEQYQTKKSVLREHLLDRLARRIPDIRERVEVCEVGTPRTMHRYSRNPGGAVYGYSFGSDSHSVYRSQLRTTLPGLYQCGAWTISSGFSGAIASGYAAAGTVLEDAHGKNRLTGTE